MTCLSCLYWRRDGCAKNCAGFPHVGDFCRQFCREPGVDEKYWSDDDER